MVFLLKTWAWLKDHYVTLLVVAAAAIIAHVYVAARNSEIYAAYQRQQEALQEQIVGLQNIIDAEVQQTEQNLNEFYAELRLIEETYAERLKQLEADRDKAKKKYNTLYQSDVKAFILAVEKRYGIKFAE